MTSRVVGGDVVVDEVEVVGGDVVVDEVEVVGGDEVEVVAEGRVVVVEQRGLLVLFSHGLAGSGVSGAAAASPPTDQMTIPAMTRDARRRRLFMLSPSSARWAELARTRRSRS